MAGASRPSVKLSPTTATQLAQQTSWAPEHYSSFVHSSAQYPHLFHNQCAEFCFYMKPVYAGTAMKLQASRLAGPTLCAEVDTRSVVHHHVKRMQELAKFDKPDAQASEAWLMHGRDPLAAYWAIPLRSKSGAGPVGLAYIAAVFVGIPWLHTLGPFELHSVHRYAAGGFAEALRFLRAMAPINMQLLVKDSVKGVGLQPLHLAAQGRSYTHYLVQRMLLHWRALETTPNMTELTRAQVLEFQPSSAASQVRLRRLRISPGAAPVQMAVEATGTALRRSDGSMVKWIHAAAEGGNPASIALACSSADLLTMRTVHGLTPLMIAAGNGHVDAVQMLVHGLPSVLVSPAETPALQRRNLGMQADDGRTAGMLAAAAGHSTALQVLLDTAKAANWTSQFMTATDAMGRSVIHHAAGCGNAQCSVASLRVLLGTEHSNAFLPDQAGDSPIVYALRAGNAKSIELLCASDPDQAKLQLASSKSSAALRSVALSWAACVRHATLADKRLAEEGLSYASMSELLHSALQAVAPFVAPGGVATWLAEAQRHAEGALPGHTPRLKRTVSLQLGALAASASQLLELDEHDGEPDGVAGMASPASSCEGSSVDASATMLVVASADAGSDSEYSYSSEDEAGGDTVPSPPPAVLPPNTALSREDSSIADVPPPAAPLSLLSSMRQQSVAELAPAEVLSQQAEAVQELATMMDLPLDAAGVLLRHHGWQVDRVVSALTADHDAALQEAGVALQPDVSADLPGSDDELECPVCLDDVAPSDMLHTGCGHLACKPCWQAHLAAEIDRHGRAVAAKACCPVSGCGKHVPSRIWEVATHGVIRRRYRKFLVQSFVRLNVDMVWCPRDGCNSVVQHRGAGRDVLCGRCGTYFCKSCEAPAHAPATCAEVTQWRSDCELLENAATRRTLMRNFKQCPKCKTYLERTSGCNHMTCYNPQCKHEFCYMCKGPWSEHGSSTGGFFKCNIYEQQRKDKPHVWDWEGYGEQDKAVLDAKSDIARERFFMAARQAYSKHEDGITAMQAKFVELNEQEATLRDLSASAPMLQGSSAQGGAAAAAAVGVASGTPEERLRQVVSKLTLEVPTIAVDVDRPSADDIEAMRNGTSVSSREHWLECNALVRRNGDTLKRPPEESTQPSIATIQVPLCHELPLFEVRVQRWMLAARQSPTLTIGIGGRGQHARGEAVGSTPGSIGLTFPANTLQYGTVTGETVQLSNHRGLSVGSTVGVGLLFDSKLFESPQPVGVVFTVNSVEVYRVKLRHKGQHVNLYPSICMQGTYTSVVLQPFSALPASIVPKIEDVLPPHAAALARVKQLLERAYCSSAGSHSSSGQASDEEDSSSKALHQMQQLAITFRRGGERGSHALWQLGPSALASMGPLGSVHREQTLQLADSKGAGVDLASPHASPLVSARSERLASVPATPLGPAAATSPRFLAVASGAGYEGLLLQELLSLVHDHSPAQLELAANRRQRNVQAITAALRALADYHHFCKWLAVHVMYLENEPREQAISAGQREEVLKALYTAAQATASTRTPSLLATSLAGGSGRAASSAAAAAAAAGSLSSSDVEKRLRTQRDVLYFQEDLLDTIASEVFSLCQEATPLHAPVSRLQQCTQLLLQTVDQARSEVEMGVALMGEAPMIRQLRKEA